MAALNVLLCGGFSMPFVLEPSWVGPPSTADELALEAIAAFGLQPAETELLGGWLLRADSGFTHRANSVLPLRAPRMPLDEALAIAQAWYATRGLPLQIHVPTEARRLLDAELAERGWAAEMLTQVRTARLDAVPASTDSPPVEIADAPSDEWLALYRGGGGLAPSARALLARHDTVAFAGLRIDGRVAAVGRGVVDEAWLGVMAVEVDPAYRRQGLASAMMTGLWQWGAARGALRSYLQVEAANEAAGRLYEKLGYAIHHEYHYRYPAAS